MIDISDKDKKTKAKSNGIIQIVMWRLLIVIMIPLCLIADVIACIPMVIVINWGKDDNVFPHTMYLIENW